MYLIKCNVNQLGIVHYNTPVAYSNIPLCTLQDRLHKHACLCTFGFHSVSLFIASQFLFGIKTITVTMYWITTEFIQPLKRRYIHCSRNCAIALRGVYEMPFFAQLRHINQYRNFFWTRVIDCLRKTTIYKLLGPENRIYYLNFLPNIHSIAIDELTSSWLLQLLHEFDI